MACWKLSSLVWTNATESIVSLILYNLGSPDFALATDKDRNCQIRISKAACQVLSLFCYVELTYFQMWPAQTTDAEISKNCVSSAFLKNGL